MSVYSEIPGKGLERLREVVAALRDPQTGCPWDLEQTHKSLLPYLIEEAYEYLHAVEEGDLSHMEEEIGDVLLQVVLHSQIAQEHNQFNLDSVCHKLCNKLIRRHPHVFDIGEGDERIDSKQVLVNWDKIKEIEKKEAKDKRFIDPSLLNLPSLFSSYKIGKKTNKVGFDWDEPSQVSYKVEEEWQELKEEITNWPNVNIERVKEELGDFLFSAAQLSRHLGMNPEDVLRDANKKFLKRFNQMEDLIKQDQKNLPDLTQHQMDHYWNIVKHNEKKNGAKT